MGRPPHRFRLFARLAQAERGLEELTERFENLGFFVGRAGNYDTLRAELLAHEKGLGLLGFRETDTLEFLDNRSRQDEARPW